MGSDCNRRAILWVASLPFISLPLALAVASDTVAPGDIRQISICPSFPLRVKSPEFVIHYCNPSLHSNLTIYPQVNEYLGPSAHLGDLSVKSDGLAVKGREHGMGFGEVISPPGYVLKPRGVKELRFQLRTFCNPPEEWRLLEVFLGSCWGQRATTTASVAIHRTRLDGGRGAAANLQISVRPELPVDHSELQFVVRYSNAADKEPFRLVLPRLDGGLGRFRELDVLVDGKPARRFSDPIAPYMQHQQWDYRLEAQESLELHVPLHRIAEIPQDWKRVEVSVKKNNEVDASIFSTLILERHDLTQGSGKSNPGKP